MLIAFITFDVHAISTETTQQLWNLYISNDKDWLWDRLFIANDTSNSFSKKSLLINFCGEALRKWIFTGEILEWKKIQYNPSQSIFLAIVCKSVAPSVTEFSEQIEDTSPDSWYIKKDGHTMSELWLICDERTWDDVDTIDQPIGCVPWCRPDSDMNTCDLSLLMPRILRDINNDLSNIWLSLSYWMTNISDETVTNDELANQLMARYFSKIGCNRAWWSCNFPKTHQEIVRFIGQAQKLVKKTKIINTKPMLAKSKECKNPELPEDMWWCMFGWNNIMLGPIVDNMYNELFFYEMLMAYYKSYLISKPYVWKFEVGINMRNERVMQTAEEVERINFESTLHMQAVNTSHRMMMQIHTFFPLHLWFILYHEAAVSFRNTAAKLYTPLDQLRFKFTDIQDDSQ